MSSRFEFRGLDELKRELRELPAELAAEAGHIVEVAADGAAADIKAEYGRHVRTGNLRDHVTVVKEISPVSAKAIVKSTARHAQLFEFGTQARHTDIGANRGSMPAGNVFVPRIVRARRRMYQELAALLQRAGLQVRGTV